jgi:predicted nucleotidyltransferase
MSERKCGRDEILRVLREHRSDLERLGVKSLALFGSAVRGEAREDSDVDLLVEFQRPIGLFEFVDVKQYLEGVLGCGVDLGTPDSLKPRLRETVLAEAVYVS